MPLSPASCWQPKLATPSATGSPKKPIRPLTRDDDPQHLITYGRRKQARIQAKQTHADQTNVARTHAETMARPDANEREAPRADDISATLTTHTIVNALRSPRTEAAQQARGRSSRAQQTETRNRTARQTSTHAQHSPIDSR